MNEDLVEKIAAFVERQCPRKMFPGEKCSEYSCSVHWTAAQIRARKFEDIITVTSDRDFKARYSNLQDKFITTEVVVE